MWVPAIALFNHSFLFLPQSLASLPFYAFYDTVTSVHLQEGFHVIEDVREVRSAGTEPKILALSSH